MEQREKYLKDKIKGSIAEELALQLFSDAGCQVYRTGHEYLFPNLFKNANTKFNKHIEKVKERDLSNFRYETESQAHKKWADLRFSSSLTGKSMSASPDFTIITPTGAIMSFEVKYRFDGNLSEEDKQKYLKLVPSPHMLIMMNTPPYIKILCPTIKLVVDTKKLEEEIKKPNINIALSSLDPEAESILKILQLHTERLELFRISDDKIEEDIKTKLFYIVQDRAESGDLVIMNSFFKTDYFIIKKQILGLYEKIINDTYSKLNNS